MPRSAFGADVALNGAFGGGAATPSTAVTGLSSRQVVFGGSSGGLAQSTFFEFDSTQGFVGLGTTAPQAPVHIRTGQAEVLTLRSDTATGPFIRFQTNTSDFGYIGNAAAILGGTSGSTGDFAVVAAFANLRLGAEGQGRAIITTQGYFGVLTTAPAGPFEVKTTGGAVGLVVNSSGHVGIGTTAPTTPLNVVGTLRLVGTTGQYAIYESTLAGTTARWETRLESQVTTGADWVLGSLTAGTKPFIVGVTALGNSLRLTNTQVIVGTSGGAQSVCFQGNNGNAVQITTAGKLGAGTTAPGAQLTVQSTAGTTNAFTVIAGTTNLVAFNVKSTGAQARVGFWSTGGTTQPSSYTTAAATTFRTFASTVPASTANYSTFTAVSGAGCAFNDRAAMEAFMVEYNRLAGVVQTMFFDLQGYGLLR